MNRYTLLWKMVAGLLVSQKTKVLFSAGWYQALTYQGWSLNFKMALLVRNQQSTMNKRWQCNIMGPDVKRAFKVHWQLAKSSMTVLSKRDFRPTKANERDNNKTKLQLFSTKKGTQKKMSQVATMKADCMLFSRLCIACQTRESNLENFCQHENQPWPPALS